KHCDCPSWCVSYDCYILVFIQKFNTHYFRFIASFACRSLIINGDGRIKKRTLPPYWRSSGELCRRPSTSAYFNGYCHYFCSNGDLFSLSLSLLSKIKVGQSGCVEGFKR